MRSSKTQNTTRDDSSSHVFVSDELVDKIDVNDLYGDDVIAGAPDVSDEGARDVTGDDVSVPSFRCIVTLDDDYERSGAVLSFVKGRNARRVEALFRMRDADDISTRDIMRIKVNAPSGVEVFDCVFAPDEHDIPTLNATIVTGGVGGVIMTFTFDVDDA